jgi:hypothetical protein
MPMHPRSPALLCVVLALGACTPAPNADAPAATSGAPAVAAAAGTPVLMTDLLKDVTDLEKKMVELAKVIPGARYTYRPAPGVRSVGEVLMHVASDNYFMPAAAGTPAPAATGIVGENYESVVAFEKRSVSPDSAVAAMTASFAFLKDAMQKASPASMTESKKMFGADYTGQQMWIMATTHLHEHLGQLIAYARANNVTPPWSK